MFEWTNGPLPSDIKNLCKIAVESPEMMAKIWDKIRVKFTEIEGKKLVNIRLEETRIEQDKYRESQRIKGIKSAEKRATVVAAGGWEPNSNPPSPSPSKKKKDATSPNVKVAIDYFSDEVNELKGFRPQIGGKDAGLLKSALKKRGLEAIQDQIDFFLSSEKSKEHLTIASALSADTYNKFMMTRKSAVKSIREIQEENERILRLYDHTK
jgi:hypothetical protein